MPNVAAKVPEQTGPNNIDMHPTRMLTGTFAQGLSVASLFAAPRFLLAGVMGLKRQKVCSGNAAPRRSGVGETSGMEPCTSLVLANLVAAEARADAALNSGAVLGSRRSSA